MIRRKVKTIEEARKACKHIIKAGFNVEVYMLNPTDISGNIAFGWFKCVKLKGAVIPVGIVNKFHKPIAIVDSEPMNVYMCDEFEIYVENP